MILLAMLRGRLLKEEVISLTRIVWIVVSFGFIYLCSVWIGIDQLYFPIAFEPIHHNLEASAEVAVARKELIWLELNFGTIRKHERKVTSGKQPKRIKPRLFTKNTHKFPGRSTADTGIMNVDIIAYKHAAIERLYSDKKLRTTSSVRFNLTSTSKNDSASAPPHYCVVAWHTLQESISTKQSSSVGVTRRSIIGAASKCILITPNKRGSLILSDFAADKFALFTFEPEESSAITLITVFFLEALF
ncbi:hypothetical protein Ahy_A06g030336 isoform A [Arachis hypogaea]|uniref:Uncharacterized protein n=1 Tax=Arachis hypogaea TaxID=3818 RepID=A0A445CW06_ARAHY|nr:hypothetical protein Ahy_A06g030336 isoform A [Arachis hypogaea]